MKICSSCGAKVEDDQLQLCPICGTRLTTPVISSFGGSEQQPIMTATPTELGTQYQMKWYKFLIYFALFFGALINFIGGIQYITGNIHAVEMSGITPAMVYSEYGFGLKMVDTVFGIMMIAMAAFGIYTRFRLAKYKANAPMCVYLLYGAGAVLSLAYSVALRALIGASDVFAYIFSLSNVLSLAVSALVVYLNYLYFSKRKELFNN